MRILLYFLFLQLVAIVRQLDTDQGVGDIDFCSGRYGQLPHFPGKSPQNRTVRRISLILLVLACPNQPHGQTFSDLPLSHPIYDLLDRLGSDLTTADWTVRLSDAGKQHTEIVVDFRHRADGRARI